MRKKISVYWPLVVIVPFAAIALLHAWQTAQQQMPLAAEQLSAELARAVSYGLVGSEGQPHVKPLPTSTALVPARAI